MKLTPNELRIGNWVLFEWEQVQIWAIFEDSGVNVLDVGTVSMNQIDPIPLTTEILEKCGYKKSNISDYNILKLPGDNHLLEPEDGCINISDYGELITIEVPINYLHQLQNLYFALTGEELEYKP